MQFTHGFGLRRNGMERNESQTTTCDGGVAVQQLKRERALEKKNTKTH